MPIQRSPVLYLFSGLPGTGKSTLAQRLASHASAAYLRIDTIEQALRDLCGVSVLDQGYRLAYRMAKDNLSIGIGVVADCCNPIGLTRRDWMEVATSTHRPYVNIEITCSDPLEHRRRVETRVSQVEGLRLPTWKDVIEREYEAWSKASITLDTAGISVDESFRELLDALGLDA